jgi:2-oxo-4-hydroxy-4-carboxy-5-ureidoimidazoline decarboxylase
MNQSLRAISEINSLTEEEFVRIIGPVFEHSPWIAKAAASARPFLNLDLLEKTLHEIVLNSGEAKQIELIRAHPDLVGHAALQGNLTNESTREQSAAGLGNLTPGEIALFQKLNAAYREKFRFQFVICARLNKKEAILRGFDSRLQHSREHEIQTALGEIFKIAQLRLRDLIEARG